MSGKIIVKRTPSGLPAMAYRDGAKALLTFGGNADGSPAEHVGPTTSVFETLNANPEHWVPWGNTDEHPYRVSMMMRRSPIGRAGLRRITKTIYGQRLFTYKITGYDDSSNPIIQHVVIPEWEVIMRQSNFNAVRIGLIQDYAYFDICFPEIRFNGNKTKVWGIDYQKATHTRMALMDADTGIVPMVYISGRFPNCTIAQCESIPVIDYIRYPDQMETLKADYKTFKYIMPIYWPDPLNDYYPEAFWYSAKEHIEINTQIPIMKKAMFRNQMSLKYEIQIPFEYFYELYPDFKKMTEAEQDAIVDDLYTSIIQNLTGEGNQQKAIMSFYSSGTGPNAKPVGQWVIKPIDDKMKNDAWLPDESASGSMIQFAMMLNPALSGQGNTGGDYTGGANNGGSNIRESGLDVRSMTQSDRDLTNSYFNFCRDYNGWDPEVQLGTQDMILTTLDQGPGTANVIS